MLSSGSLLALASRRMLVTAAVAHSTVCSAPASAVGGWFRMSPVTSRLRDKSASPCATQLQTLPEQASSWVQSLSSSQILLASGPAFSQRLSSGSTLPISRPWTRQVSAGSPQPTLTSTGSSLVEASPFSSLPRRPCAETAAASRANAPSPVGDSSASSPALVSPTPPRSWNVSEWKKLPKVTGSIVSWYSMPTGQLSPGHGSPTNCTIPSACGSFESSPTATCALPATAHDVRRPKTAALRGEVARHTGGSPGAFVADVRPWTGSKFPQSLWMFTGSSVHVASHLLAHLSESANVAAPACTPQWHSEG